MTRALITVSRRVFCTSTTGDSPVTVTVSSRAPTFISIGIVIVAEPASSMPSRLTELNPGSVNVTVYVPGRRSTMRYNPELSVVDERVFSISTVLAASTVTPGSTAPDPSLTVPVIDACARTIRGATITNAIANSHLPRAAIADILPPGKVRHQWARQPTTEDAEDAEVQS